MHLFIIRHCKAFFILAVYNSRLSHRIDSMETAIIPLSVNLDKVLEKLNGVNKDKKIRRKDMENIFDDIVKGEAGRYLTYI